MCDGEKHAATRVNLRGKMNRYISILFPAAGILYGIYGIYYIITKARLILEYGGTYVGNDIVIAVYIVSAISVILAVVGTRINRKSKKLKPIAWLAVVLTVAVLISWGVLNIGGYIISYGEMIKG